MKKVILILGILLFGWNVKLTAQCPPSSASSSDVTKAVAMVSYDGFNFTGVLINNVNEDGRLFFLTSSYPFSSNCGITNTLSGHISNISFTWINGSTTSGATLLSTSSEVSLLELDGNPPFSTFSLLGYYPHVSSTGYCITNYENSLSKLDISSFANGNVSTNCNLGSSNSYSFSSGINNNAAIVKEWSGNVNMETLNFSKGAPLINSDREVIGIYVTKTVDTLCGSENAYFLENPTGHGNIHSYLGTGQIRGIKYTPCVDDKIETVIFNASETVKAGVRIIGKSQINNVAVIFRAGEEVILDDGFDSGNNFIAEITPCFSTVEEISAKTNESYLTSKNISKEGEKIKAYPTVLINDKVTIEKTGLEFIDYIIYDLQGKIIVKENRQKNSTYEVQLPNLSRGVYFLKVKSENYSKTIKLIKE